MERLERYSESEKMVVKNNRKIFYRNGLYIINCLFIYRLRFMISGLGLISISHV